MIITLQILGVVVGILLLIGIIRVVFFRKSSSDGFGDFLMDMLLLDIASDVLCGIGEGMSGLGDAFEDFGD